MMREKKCNSNSKTTLKPITVRLRQEDYLFLREYSESRGESLNASLIIKCLTHEPESSKAIAWLESYGSEEMVAPWFLSAEVVSVLCRKVWRKELTQKEAHEALALLDFLHIRLVSDLALVNRALELAIELEQLSVYDTMYLAVAEQENCHMWTADKKFVGAVSPNSPCVRSI